MKRAAAPERLPATILTAAIVLACVVIGAVGLVLPIIPGLLFLAIAAFIVVKRFPAVDARLRRHRAIGRHLDRADGFADLSLAEKIQVTGLFCVKMLLDTAALIRSLAAKLDKARR